MKKKIVASVIAILLLFWSTISFAVNSESIVEDINEDLDQLLEDQLNNYVDEDLYLIDENNVEITQSVDGNAYVMAKEVNIADGIFITGNLFVMAQKINIGNVEVYGSAYIMAEELNCSGKIASIYAMCKNGNFDNKFSCSRSLKLFGNSIYLDGYVGNNIYASVESIELGENAVIDGAFNYSAKQEAIKNEKAKVEYETYYENSKDMGIQKNATSSNNAKNNVRNLICVILKTIIMVWFLNIVLKKYSKLKRTSNHVVDELKNCGLGLISTIVVSISIAVVFIIGISTGLLTGISLIILSLFGITLYFAQSIFAVEIAERINKKAFEKNKFIISTFVAIGLWIVEFIPIVGNIVSIITILSGVGICWNLIFQKNKEIKA